MHSWLIVSFVDVAKLVFIDSIRPSGLIEIKKFVTSEFSNSWSKFVSDEYSDDRDFVSFTFIVFALSMNVGQHESPNGALSPRMG